ncbi:MAG: ammonium transporter, partial [Planctomycetaceae bacterium]|nr:ammonium transporter [Planctomycetaceae bacterium]
MKPIRRFLELMRYPEQRKVFYALLGGKLLGVTLLALAMWGAAAYMDGKNKAAYAAATKQAAADPAKPQAAPAQTAPGQTPSATAAAPAAPAAPEPPPPYVNPMNNMWVLSTAFLVFFMQAGFMMLEAGFAR